MSKGQASYPGLSLCALGEVDRALDVVLEGQLETSDESGDLTCPASPSVDMSKDGHVFVLGRKEIRVSPEQRVSFRC